MKKSEKKPVSPWAAYVCTTPEVAEADSEILDCREDLSVTLYDKVPAPAYSNKTGGKSAK